MKGRNRIFQNFEDAIGDTPLIRINSLSDETGCEILGKAEFMNPGGSVKDRAAKFIIQDAEQSGILKSGGTVVEGTAGNTGIGLTHICNSKGYKTIIIIPETQSIEKIDTLRTLGAEVRLVPAVPYSNENNYVKVAKRVAEETENSIWANQFDNLSNKRAHYHTTGPEIWNDTKGKIDFWVSSIGTGGTYAGTAQYLKEQNSNVKCFIADPFGSGIYSFVKSGKIEIERSSITEGIGQGRITKNLEGMLVDDAIRIDDKECVRILHQVLKEDGLFLGGSVGINLGAAYQIAKSYGPGKTIVTILCDSGSRYQTKLYNNEFLKNKGLLE